MMTSAFFSGEILSKELMHPVPVPGKKVRQKTGSKYNELDM
jgi:hypothetical protein